MYRIDLNSDLGESYGAYSIGNDEKVLEHITSANIACGFHAGDYNVMMETVKTCHRLGVGIGAHPGFPDLHGFGRREMNVSSEEVFNLVVYQIGALLGVAKVHGAIVQHVKPHGALYNMASKNKEIAEAIAKAVHSVNTNLILFGLAGSELVKAGEAVGLQVAQEVFADRTYQPDGTLTSRTEKNAMIHDTEIAIQRVIRMVKEGKVTAVNGQEIPIQADTICVHGDEDSALLLVRKLKERLQEEKINMQCLGAKNHA